MNELWHTACIRRGCLFLAALLAALASPTGSATGGTLVREGGSSALVAEAPSRQAAAADDQVNAEAAQGALQRAREHAAADRHGAAIRSYQTAFELDPSLIPLYAHELGYQYTWAERAPEAIAWFRMRLEREPGDVGARLGLARALSWSGRALEADEQYARVLEQEPGKLEARRGRARMLMWTDRNRAAMSAWQRILADHPDDLESRLGLAQATNWAGLHRSAAHQYEAILADHPGHAEAQRGLLSALRWGGQPGRALQRMRDWEMGPAHGQLYRELSRESRSAFDLGLALSEDSDDLRVWHALARWESRPALANSGAVGVHHRRFEQPGQPDATGNSLELGGRRQLSEHWRANLYGQLHQFRSDAPINNVGATDELDWTFLGYDAWLTWQRDWRWRVDLSSDRGFLDTHRSLGYQVAVTSGGLSTDLHLARHLQLNAMARLRSFSDDNERYEGRLGLLWAWEGTLSGAVGPSVASFHSTEASDRGYWNPEDFVNVGVDLRLRLEEPGRPVYAGADLRAGHESADGDGYGVLSWSLRLGWRAHARADLELAGGASDSRLSGSGGYSRDWGQLLVRLYF